MKEKFHEKIMCSHLATNSDRQSATVTSSHLPKAAAEQQQSSSSSSRAAAAEQQQTNGSKSKLLCNRITSHLL